MYRNLNNENDKKTTLGGGLSSKMREYFYSILNDWT